MNEKSDRGIFARWFESNGGSNRGTSLKEVKMFMKKCGCSDFLINVMNQCWKDFDKIPNARISIIIPSGRCLR